MRTLRLVRGRDWVEVAPLVGTVARVIGGTLWSPGELVALPEGVSWDHAAVASSDGNTRVAPGSVERLYDVVTDWRHRPETPWSALEAVEPTSAELPGTLRPLDDVASAA